MPEDASPTGSPQALPPAGWYPDPVARAEHRYWNGTAWTGNTRGRANPEAAVAADAALAQAEAQAAAEEEARATAVRAAQETGVHTARAESAAASAAVAGEPAGSAPSLPATRQDAVAGPTSPTEAARTAERSSIPDRPSTMLGHPTPASLFEPEAPARPVPRPTDEARRPDPPADGGTSPADEAAFWAGPSSTDADTEKRGAPGWALALVGLVVLAVVGAAGYLAFDRLGDTQTTETLGSDADAATGADAAVGADDADGAQDQVAAAGGSDETVAQDATDDADDATAPQADVESLRAELRDALDAAETAQAEAAAAEARATAAEEHVQLMRSWFTRQVLDRADNAFDAEVQRACGAEAEPTLDNTTFTRVMEPAGTHTQLVAKALACRAEG